MSTQELRVRANFSRPGALHEKIFRLGAETLTTSASMLGILKFFDILVTGPATVELEFIKHVHKHHHTRFRRS